MKVRITLGKEVADRDEGIALIQQVRKKLESHPTITVEAIISDNVKVSELPPPPD